MKYLSGIAITFLMALVSSYLATLHFFKAYQLSSLVICIVLGMIIGNFFHQQIPSGCQVGIKFSQQKLLRLGVVLYGFFITFQQIADVGVVGLVTDVIIITTTFVGGTWIGMKLLGMDRETAMLTAVGSSICGAAAILGAEPVVKSKSHQTAVAVATVVIFGTLAMFLYPIMFRLFHITAETMGIYTGATIHEVAQVVAAGNAMGQDIGSTSVIVKLTRVMMLAPFLIILGFYLSKSDNTGNHEKAKITIPWFAVFFVVVAGINSLDIIPHEGVHLLTKSSVFLLSMAMGALGIDTNIAKIRGVGLKPVLLAAILWCWLIAGGYGITMGIQTLLHS
ncbi:YeiH family protein [Vibrio sp. PP-XX7]